jgi:predicted transcriptional regulator
MAQETLNSLIAVMMTLSVQEQEQVIAELQANVRGLRQVPAPYTMEEIDARLDESERDIEDGRFYTTDEVFHSQYSVAV